jgi:RNA polymerase sigma-70 factor (ECF subfamily)
VSTEPSLSEPRQGNLLPRVATGDVDAFERLYDQHSPILYALLLRMLANAEDAQEVLQETFVQIWNRASMFDSVRGSEIAWLISIARSRGIDRMRSRRVRGEREQEAMRDISVRSANVHTDVATENVIVHEQSRAVRQALEQLPENQRSALELAYFEGLSQSEIATRLNQPLGTVKTRMQLGMKKLRESLREAYGR